jgi:uncharacterized protein (TIGR00303 family)
MNQREFPNISCLNQTNFDIQKFGVCNPIFICIISNTETSNIPGITVAGENTELIKYTSAADSEYLYYGFCKSMNKIPVTPDGKPTPAVISRTALQLADIPFLVVDGGSFIKPSIPFISFDLKPGKNIINGDAVDIFDVRKAYDYGIILGRQLAKTNDLVIIGESIPGGTTTALGVLTALGIDAKFKVSSSMPKNPHDLKNRIIAECIQKTNVNFDTFKNDPFAAISYFGDPMIPSVAGICDGVITAGGRVMLAGGTQMSAVIAVLKTLKRPLENVSIGTTSYVAHDKHSNLYELVTLISPEVPVYVVDLYMNESGYAGLQAFAKGFIKEGVGAGGLSIVASLKSKGTINGPSLLKAIEQQYQLTIDTSD